MERISLIGNTPMIKIYYEFKGKKNYIYAKLEYYNLTGSIKDRAANYIIKKAKENEELKEGMPIIEATSGNMGISLSALGKYYKHPVYIFMPDWASKERESLMKLYGANIKLISKEEGGFIKCIEEAKKLAENKNGYLANQFANKYNTEVHYKTTGKEILEQIEENIGGFISGVGTGGTLTGIGKRLKERNEDTKIVAIEPDKMQLLSKGNRKEQHSIEGIADDFIPKIIDRNEEIIDEVILVNDEDSVNMSRKLSKELGLGVGISSGANLIGSILLQEKINKPVVTVFADDNKKYLSTDLVKDIEKNNKFISNNIKLLNYNNV